MNHAAHDTHRSFELFKAFGKLTLQAAAFGLAAYMILMWLDAFAPRGMEGF